MKKNLGGPKLDLKLGFLPFSQVASLVILDIAQGCSLGQCLTSSRVETSKKKNKKNKKNRNPNWGRNDLFYSNVIDIHSNLLVLVLKEDLRAIHYQRPLEYLEKHLLLHDVHQINYIFCM